MKKRERRINELDCVSKCQYVPSAPFESAQAAEVGADRLRLLERSWVVEADGAVGRARREILGRPAKVEDVGKRLDLRGKSSGANARGGRGERAVRESATEFAKQPRRYPQGEAVLKGRTERTIEPVDELTIIRLGWAPPAMISEPLEGDMHIELSAWAPSLRDVFRKDEKQKSASKPRRIVP